MRQKISLGLLLILLVAIPITLELGMQSQDNRNRAQEVTSDTEPVRGAEGDLWADIVLGKPNFAEINPGETVANKLWIPRGVLVDRSVTPNRMYVYDGGNNRILGFRNLDGCISSTNNPLNCSADIVLGQPSMNASACNGDSAFQRHPQRAPASNASLCTENESQLSISEGASGASMAMDTQGNLYVTDFFNHRVLKYNRPFDTDTIADDVWGQNDFTGNSCNQGKSAPDATTLCFSWGDSNNWTAGVDVDPLGNVWVADSGNNRVLRFPAGSKTADVILGQPDGSSKTPGNGLNQLHDPAVVRVNSAGKLYVADGANSRVLVFSGPFATNMEGQVFENQVAVHGIEFDPIQTGKMWFYTRSNSLELWDETTKAISRTLGARGGGNFLDRSGGSIGVDSHGRLYYTAAIGDNGNDLVMFDTTATGSTPTKKFYGYGANARTNRSLSIANGIAIADNQLIIADGDRLMYWNDPTTLATYKPSDGIVPLGLGITSMKADKQHHLYVSTAMGGDTVDQVRVYQLPLTDGAKTPIAVIKYPFQLLGGGQLANPGNFVAFTGIVPSDDGNFLWLSQAGTNRVLRVRNPLTSPVVDIILGQADATSILCNRVVRGGQVTGTTLCLPGALSLDRQGNLYVSDHSLEIQGNMRLLEFNSNLFPTNNTSVLYGIAASKIFPVVATWEPAFDSQNRMVVGFNPYWTGNPTINQNGGGYEPAYYDDPLGTSTEPQGFFKDFYSMAYTAAFDDQNNLYIGDLDRSRVLIYKKPFGTYAPPAGTPTPTTGQATTPTPTSGSTTTLPGDIIINGCVDIFDYNKLVQDFGLGTPERAMPASGSPANINRAGNSADKVDIFDYNVLVENFGHHLPSVTNCGQ